MAGLDGTKITKVLIISAICLCALIFVRTVQRNRRVTEVQALASNSNVGLDDDDNEIPVKNRNVGVDKYDGADDDDANAASDNNHVEDNGKDDSMGTNTPRVIAKVKTSEAPIQNLWKGHYKPYNFIHIPKTAGETMEATFGLVKSHRTLLQRENDQLCSVAKTRCMGTCACDRSLSSEDRRYWVEKADQGKKIQVLTFAIVRNPFDRTVSWYYFCRKGHGGKGGTKNLPNPKKACQLARDLSFTDWVEAVYVTDTDAGWGLHRAWSINWTQATWLKDENGNIDWSTIFVGRYEALEDSINQAEKLMGGKKIRPVSHRNPSSWPEGHDYHVYYDDKSRKIIETVFAEDLKLFDYEF